MRPSVERAGAAPSATAGGAAGGAEERLSRVSAPKAAANTATATTAALKTGLWRAKVMSLDSGGGAPPDQRGPSVAVAPTGRAGPGRAGAWARSAWGPSPGPGWAPRGTG